MDEFAFYNKTTALRIGLTPTSTLTSSNTTLPGNLTLPGPLVFSGTSAGTNLQLINSTTVTSGTTTTVAFAGLGVTPGTALENYALTGHRWWTGSSGTTSGTVSMQLSSGGLSLSTITTSAIVPYSNATGVNIGNVYLGGSTQQLYGTFSTINTGGNVSYTVAQVMGGYMVRNAQSNGSYTDTLPSAAAFFLACNSIVGATFTFVICPFYSVTIATGSGGGIYCGLPGNNGGYATANVGQTAQSSSSILLPNSATYVLMFIMTSSTTYAVFIK